MDKVEGGATMVEGVETCDGATGNRDFSSHRKDMREGTSSAPQRKKEGVDMGVS